MIDNAHISSLQLKWIFPYFQFSSSTRDWSVYTSYKPINALSLQDVLWSQIDISHSVIYRWISLFLMAYRLGIFKVKALHFMSIVMVHKAGFLQQSYSMQRQPIGEARGMLFMIFTVNKSFYFFQLYFWGHICMHYKYENSLINFLWRYTAKRMPYVSQFLFLYICVM